MPTHVYIEAVEGVVQKVAAAQVLYQTWAAIDPTTGYMVAISDSTPIPGPREIIYERSPCLHLDMDHENRRCRRCGRSLRDASA